MGDVVQTIVTAPADTAADTLGAGVELAEALCGDTQSVRTAAVATLQQLQGLGGGDGTVDGLLGEACANWRVPRCAEP
jgi:hypothetical protein